MTAKSLQEVLSNILNQEYVSLVVEVVLCLLSLNLIIAVLARLLPEPTEDELGLTSPARAETSHGSQWPKARA